MNWILSLFTEQTALQAVIIVSLIIAAGLGLGKIKVWGISLGVTFVFFVGILAGHLGLAINPYMLSYAQSFGLVLFVYALGVQVGPGFIGSLRQEGMLLNALSLGVIVLGTILAVALSFGTGISLADMMGILCGATTNTPALAAAQQTLEQLHLPTTGAALSCAVTYPLGVVGVILALVCMDKFFTKPAVQADKAHEDPNHTFIAAFQVHNPGIFQKRVQDVAQISRAKFVISRLWRYGTVQIPTADTILHANDRLLVVTTEKEVEVLTALFGEQENRDWNKEDIDWDAIDSQLISKHVYITDPAYNGKKLGQLRLRNVYGITVSRVMRSGVKLLATPGLVLQLGDRLTVVGEAVSISNVEKRLGNHTNTLKDPNMASMFIGVVIGLILGSIPIFIPGMSTPVKLGLAGGPIVVGILMGAYGPRFHLVTYSTRSANLMIRGIGLSLYLACLGLDAGSHFFETVMRPEGALWIVVGFVLTILPVLIVGWIALHLLKLDFANTCGMLCGSMANPMALNYANTISNSDSSSVSYATVYPLCMFSRVIIAQIVLMAFLG